MEEAEKSGRTMGDLIVKVPLETPARAKRVVISGGLLTPPICLMTSGAIQYGVPTNAIIQRLFEATFL